MKSTIFYFCFQIRGLYFVAMEMEILNDNERKCMTLDSKLYHVLIMQQDKY